MRKNRSGSTEDESEIKCGFRDSQDSKWMDIWPPISVGRLALNMGAKDVSVYIARFGNGN